MAAVMIRKTASNATISRFTKSALLAAIDSSACTSRSQSRFRFSTISRAAEILTSSTNASRPVISANDVSGFPSISFLRGGVTRNNRRSFSGARSYSTTVDSSTKIQDGPLIGMLKRYHNQTVHRALNGIQEPFSIVDPDFLPCLDGTEGSWINKNASCQILGPGMILLKNYISLLGLVDIVTTCQHLGVGPGGFYEPSNRYGHKLRHHMMCLGRNWEPATGYEKRCRSTDGSEPPPLPIRLACLAEAAVKDAQTHLDEHELPSMCPDVCVANFYDLRGRLGLHQYRDESSDSLSRGLPVVSISIGGIEFWYGHTRDENKLAKVMLDTGDVLIFGGESRLIFHGVRRVHPRWSSQRAALSMRLCSLNLTFRQF